MPKKTIYVVTRTLWDTSSVEGAYSTRRRAHALCDAKENDKASWEVSELDLDRPLTKEGAARARKVRERHRFDRGRNERRSR